MNNIENYNEETFEKIKHIDENGNEYWSAKELMKILEYSKWENFHKAIKSAEIACKKSNINVFDNFIKINTKKVKNNKNNDDYKLTRFACYLIIQNCDSRKKAVSLSKSYIILQTIKNENLQNLIKNRGN